MSENTGLPLNQENLDRAAKAATSIGEAYREAAQVFGRQVASGLAEIGAFLEKALRPEGADRKQ